MPSRSSAPKKIKLDHSPETAIFQHSPSSGSRLRAEWEPGCQADEVYDRILPAWRANIRRYLVRRLRAEKLWMSKWQGGVRTELRDRYFYWTAVFGTHTFFLTFLPLFFFFGHPHKGRGLLYVVGLGIYASSFVKDLVCTPRPYSPPMMRLTMSSHHHEYGFLSSHSTNSVSMAFFL
ncbi:MAG: Sphingosine-1-phosphate phosphatase 2, partial [Tremellales sp. Tagirdzhanova-0007]